MMTSRALVVILVAGTLAIVAASPRAASPARIDITTLSTDAQRVTGGDVLVQIALPAAADAPSLQVSANGTAAFHPAAAPHTLMGLVTGLVNGKNTLTAVAHGAPRASLDVTNYPITG